MADRRYRITVRPETSRRWGWAWMVKVQHERVTWSWTTVAYGWAWTEDRAWRAADKAIAKERRRNAREDAAKASERTREVES